MAQNEQLNNKKMVTGRVEKVVFHDQKTGRTILSIEQENGRPCSVIGNVKIPEEGSIITATGKWRKDDKYGWQFMADDIQDTSRLEEKLEPVEDGLIHAVDFSNVLNKHLKDFRKVEWLVKYEPLDNDDDDEVYDWEDIDKDLETIKECREDKKAEEEPQVPEKKEPITVPDDGATYNKEMTWLISGPKKQATFIIPNQVTCIGGGAFLGTRLESVVIPDSVSSIRDGAFEGCPQLKEIIVEEGNNLFRSIDGVLYDNGVNRIVWVPRGKNSVTISEPVKHIGYSDFKGCQELTSITIPNSVISIGDCIFQDCSQLKEIFVEEGNSHFRSVDGVLYDYEVSRIVWVPRGKNSVSIPDSVKHIGYCAFKGCQELTSITIPNSVISIGNWAFQGCSSLATIAIPDSVAKIGTRAFEGCTGLRCVEISDLVKWCSIEFSYLQSSSLYTKELDFSANPLVYAKQLELNGNILKNLIIPDGIKVIKDIAFFNCNSLEYVAFTSEVTEIGKFAFYGCSNLIVDIPDTVSKFGADAFKGCKNYNLDRTVDLDLKDVTFFDNRIRVPNPIGGWTEIEDTNVDSTVNTMRKHLVKKVPFLTVHYGSNATLVNAKELHDAVITLKIKNNLSALIREGCQPAEILKRIDGLSEKYIREFIPRDMTPYINFLINNHAGDKYPVVPIEEFIGGCREEGTLYTILIDSQPNIVWENNNDARSTYVFRCTEEDYEETRQLVFDYIMAEETGKRKLLRTDNCLKIFKEKPRMVVHNNVNSWAQRLLCDPNYKVDMETSEVIESISDQLKESVEDEEN